ncbi:hypothetical protein HZI73_15585 [Vallitalea pronyensis]|uniref:Fibronectin type-III domain-containing protein n=1 Tax=Vallitalea pronyensis TaxID=1348613 RepID=A0A8J8SHP8_9FIRM|nr:SPRY domain-containing protein [Vallitalea pronyensis]QUI23623.1 hypothetical protein HZI73_15585 [Vallitalea pronyensis]
MKHKRNKIIIMIALSILTISTINISASTDIVTFDTINNGTNYTLSNGDLTADIFGNGSRNVIANVGKQTGKWYWEIKADSGSPFIGIGTGDNDIYTNSFLYGHYAYFHAKNNMGERYGSTFGDGNVIGVALDLDLGKIEFFIDGVSQGVLEPEIDTSLTYYPKVYNGSTTSSTIITANFGATAFEHQIPNGYIPYNNATVVQPNIPTNLTATQSSNSIVLNWDTITDADSYTILRSTTSGVIDTVIASSITGTTYTDTNVTPGVTYYYVVRAVKSGVESADSNIASAMVEENTNFANLQIKLSTTDIYEYRMTMTDVDAFKNWYVDRSNGTGLPFYSFPDDANIEPYTDVNEYLIFDKIVWFKVKEY